MRAIQPRQIKAAIDLYDNHLKDGCDKLLRLSKFLLKSERSQRVKRTLYRLGWVCGLSALVVLSSYLTIGVNMITAIGLLVAYFLGLILHSKYSPAITLPEEEHQLYQLNDELRDKIVQLERESEGSLFHLLECTELEQEAHDKGLRIKKGQVDFEQLNGVGLYQYLDAMNLLMRHRKRFEVLL